MSLVKTTRFSVPKYVGDPVNVVSIFNAFEADEIMLLDVRATTERRKPQFELIAQLAEECYVPLTYGGGLTSLDDIRRVLDIGCERVVLNTVVDTAPRLVTGAAETFGAQAVVASIDAKRTAEGYFEVFVESGTRPLEVDPVTYACRAEELGAGEILLTSIDRDGTMDGYDVDLLRSVSDAVTIPVIACGGAGSLEDIVEVVRLGGAAAVAAGSIWLYQGRNRAVLINFPRPEQRSTLFA
jgi:cyclase